MAAPALPLLIVEDNPVYAELLQRLLPTLGTGIAFDTKWVDSAEKAIWELAQRPYDLMLLDYKLPGADGLSVLAYVRSQPEAVQPAIVMLTGIGREEVAVQAMKQGAKDYLSKDHLDVPSLLRAITSALERKRAEDALAEERALLRALMDTIPDSIYFKDPASRYTRVNQAQAQFLGVAKPEQAIGKTDADYLPAATAAARRADEEQLLTTGQPIVGKIEADQRPGNPPAWFSVTKVPLRDRFGHVTGLAGISRDITDRKQLEDQLARTAEELRARNSQMEADIALAREIQEAFLPQQYPSFPAALPTADSALRFHHLYRPTAAVGGDFFDVFALSDTQAGVFLCDVMGHGVRAALVTAIIRALIEELRPVATDAGQFLTAMNHSLLAILRQTRVPMFASAFYLVADAARGEVHYSNAGHPDSLHVRRATGTVEALNFATTKPGPALGVFENTVFPSARRPWSTGDLALLFTDGIYEVSGPGGDHFGLDRLLAAVQARATQPMPVLVAGLFTDVQQFAGSGEFSDDVCLVAVEAARLEHPAS